jgi:hypothetical protein
LTWSDGDVWEDIGLLTTPDIESVFSGPANSTNDPGMVGLAWNMFSASNANLAFSPGYPGNPNFQPAGFVCVTCAMPPIATKPPKAASGAPKPATAGAPTVLLPVPSSP